MKEQHSRRPCPPLWESCARPWIVQVNVHNNLLYSTYILYKACHWSTHLHYTLRYVYYLTLVQSRAMLLYYTLLLSLFLLLLLLLRGLLLLLLLHLPLLCQPLPRVEVLRALLQHRGHGWHHLHHRVIINCEPFADLFLGWKYFCRFVFVCFTFWYKLHEQT